MSTSRSKTEQNLDAVVMAGQKSSPPFAALRAFDAVGRRGGIRRAAESLGVDHAVVSRHLRTLEAWVGVPLLERLQAGGRLTPAGERYHARISAAFAEISDATLELMSKDQGARLKIFAAPGIASRWLARRLESFRSAVPGVSIELQSTDAPPNFALHQGDADIRYVADRDRGELQDPMVRWVELARPLTHAVASPEFLARCSPLLTVRDLLRVPLIQKKSDDPWRSWLRDNGLDDIGTLPGIRYGQAHLTIEAARNGLGVALGNPFLMDDDLHTGRLVRIDVGHPTKLGAYYFGTRTDMWTAPAVTRLRRWLHKCAAESLAQAGTPTDRAVLSRSEKSFLTPAG